MESFWGLIKGVSDTLTTCVKVTLAAIAIFGAVVLLGGSRPAMRNQYSLEETQKAIEYVIAKKIPERYASKISIPKMSQAFYTAQNTFDVPSIFLISIGYYESKYSLGAVGDGGKSIGIMQVGKRGRRICREHCGLMKTENEQILCGGCWLRKNIDWCGTLNRGFTGYASGRCSAQIKNIVRKRFRLWYYLDDNVRGTKE